MSATGGKAGVNSRVESMPSKFDRVLTGGVFVALLLAGAHQFVALDLWWQLAAGRWIAEVGLPTTDPFSFGFPGLAWIEQRWLFFVAEYALSNAFGLNALIVAKLVWMAGCFWALDRAMAPAPRWARALGLAVAVVLVHSRLRVRPELATYGGVIAFLWIYERFRADPGNARALLVLPFVQLIWSNTHTLWIVGPALAWTAWAVEVAGARWRVLVTHIRVAEPLAEEARSKLLRAALVVSAAAFVTPYLFKGYFYPTTILEQIGIGSQLREVIVELRSPLEFASDRLFFGSYVAGLLLSLLVWLLPGRPPLFRLAVWCGFVGFSFLSARNVALFAPVAGWVIAHQLGGYVASRESRDRPRLRLILRRGSRILAATIVIAMSVAAVTDELWRSRGWHQRFGFGVREYLYPIKAMAFVEEHGLPRPVLSSLADASYLVYEGGERSVYIDGRLEVYGAAAILENTLSLRQPGSMLAVADRYGLGSAVLEFPLMGAAIAAFEADPRWVAVYYNGSRVLYLRRTPETEAQAAELALDWGSEDRPSAAVPEALRSPDWTAGIAPRRADVSDALGRGALLAHVGSLDRSRDAYLEVLAARPRERVARIFLGALAWSRSNFDEAAEHFAFVPPEELERVDVLEVRVHLAEVAEAPDQRFAFGARAIERGSRTPRVLSAVTDGAFAVGRQGDAERLIAAIAMDEAAKLESSSAGPASTELAGNVANLNAALGLIAQRGGRFTEAASRYEVALGLSSDQSHLWAPLIHCYEQAGDAVAANEARRQAAKAGTRQER
ncbi:MAG: hypothetical protein VX246_02965 [Myxococcota bacterium]|nr:hypothetical protein [Myxococcota bacterium]